jgi:formylmethanofuran dehydrogenase subunit D
MVNINEVTFKACFHTMMNTRFSANLGGKDMDHVVVSSSIGTMLD